MFYTGLWAGKTFYWNALKHVLAPCYIPNLCCYYWLPVYFILDLAVSRSFSIQQTFLGWHSVLEYSVFRNNYLIIDNIFRNHLQHRWITANYILSSICAHVIELTISVCSYYLPTFCMSICRPYNFFVMMYLRRLGFRYNRLLHIKCHHFIHQTLLFILSIYCRLLSPD